MFSESVTLTDLVTNHLSKPEKYLRMALANTLYAGIWHGIATHRAQWYRNLAELCSRVRSKRKHDWSI